MKQRSEQIFFFEATGQLLWFCFGPKSNVQHGDKWDELDTSPQRSPEMFFEV